MPRPDTSTPDEQLLTAYAYHGIANVAELFGWEHTAEAARRLVELEMEEIVAAAEASWPKVARRG
jgi:hypothetical protein